jgi:uncharacterized protein (DUF4415 family)
MHELTKAEIARFRPIQEVDPGMLAAIADFRRGARPPVTSPKMRIGPRLAPDVVSGIRATGRGFSARVEKVLQEALTEG